MLRIAIGCLAAASIVTVAHASCRNEVSGDAHYAVCEFDASKENVRLFLNNASGAPYRDFAPLQSALEEQGEKLVFAMNAGMYHKDRSPVGLYVEDGEQLKNLSTRDGPGNFHLKPNGVLYVTDGGGAGVLDTPSYERSNIAIRHATQSGPMLVIDGAIHPKFLVDATSRKRRNGVGVRADGGVVFALSDTPVTFHEFATFFRDTLKTPNALYLDGTISRLYAPDLARNDPGLAMGPIVGVVKAAE